MAGRTQQCGASPGL